MASDYDFKPFRLISDYPSVTLTRIFYHLLFGLHGFEFIKDAPRGRITARPPLVYRHGLCSRLSRLTIVGRHLWRILKSGKDWA